MSSAAESAGALAAVLLAPALGAGWLAWQGGKLLVGMGVAAEQEVQNKQRQLEQEKKQRTMAAIAGHDQLVSMCQSVLAEMEQANAGASYLNAAQLEALRLELAEICTERLPEDAAQIESINARGYGRMENILARHRSLGAMKLEAPGLYSGLALADLMQDLRVAFSAALIAETTGRNVRAADPVVLERAKLNQRLNQVAGRIITALEYIVDMAEHYGLSDSSSAWFQSCFNGVDGELARLCQPTTSNESMKKGIRRLEELMDQYDLVYPGIERKRQELAALYQVYAQAAQTLGEPVRKLREFKSPEALETEMHRLQERVERARTCAEVYEKLGPAAYICYAWDEELRELGYSVKTRKKITEMVSTRPQHARLGDSKLPFYQWEESDMTQIYSVSPTCSLQLIVHEDGVVSMQTVSEGADEAETVQTQAHHCQQMRRLHERLRKNWFLMYDYEETASAGEILTAEQWLLSDTNTWGRTARAAEAGQMVVDQRQQTAKNEKAMSK